MGWIKWIEASCDHCGMGLAHELSVANIKETLKNDSCIIIGNKCFCDKKCLKEYKAKTNPRREG